MEITKKQLCEAVIKNFLEEEKMVLSELKSSDVLTSSKLAVAMEYMELIEDDDMKNFASQKEGIIFFGAAFNDESVSLSLREVLNLEPVKSDKEKLCEAIIMNFSVIKGMKRENLVDDHAFSNSNVAVAMEYLNLIKSDSIKKYAASQEGKIFSGKTFNGENVELTLRYILENIYD